MSGANNGIVRMPLSDLLDGNGRLAILIDYDFGNVDQVGFAVYVLVP